MRPRTPDLESQAASVSLEGVSSGLRQRHAQTSPQHEHHVNFQVVIDRGRDTSRDPRGQMKFSSSRSRNRSQGPYSPGSTRSVSKILIEALSAVNVEEADTFGLEESREGFFDAIFQLPNTTEYPPSVHSRYHSVAHSRVHSRAQSRAQSRATSRAQSRAHSRAHSRAGSTTSTSTRPSSRSSKEYRPDEPRSWIQSQIDDVTWFFAESTTTRYGMVVFKAALAYWLAYILCLSTVVRSWLGKYPYFAPIAVLLSHPGRTVGAQLEGTVECTIGPLVGMAVGVVTMEVSHSTATALVGKGGVITTFMVLFLLCAAWFRSYALRFHQATVTCAVCFLFICLEYTNNDAVGEWREKKLRDFGLPWGIGLAIAQLVNLFVFPSFGGRYVASSIHSAIEAAKECLNPPPEEIEKESAFRRRTTNQIFQLSEAVRDMRLEVTVFSLKSTEVEEIRNLLQALIRDLMGLDPKLSAALSDTDSGSEADESSAHESDNESDDDYVSTTKIAIGLVKKHMSRPAQDLKDRMGDLLCTCDVELMKLANHPEFVEDRLSITASIEACTANLQMAMEAFDSAEQALFAEPQFPSPLPPEHELEVRHSEIVELFLYLHPLRRSSEACMRLSTKVSEFKDRPNAGKRRIQLPNYKDKRALLRANRQVRHDRGGISAGRYFHMKRELKERVEGNAARRYVPTTVQMPVTTDKKTDEQKTEEIVLRTTADPGSVRFKLWSITHRLQQFESRFAIKVMVTICLLGIPAWLDDSNGWWNENEIWWVAIVAWLMLHPRVGGNFFDLMTRTVSVVIGALWGALAYFSRDGDPFVMAAFAAVFAHPAVFRYIRSNHPRSGLITLLTFTIVSLSVAMGSQNQTPFHVAWTRSCAIIVGVVSAVVVNWIFWPFVARHELRKGISSMIRQLGIYYRMVIAKYIYHDKDDLPTSEDIRESEITEAYLREGIIRLREVMNMTKHEIRIRGPFKEKPYDDLLEHLERFFEHLVQVRQSSQYFQSFVTKDTEYANRRLLSVRRDAVSSVLMNTYVLAGALRTGRPIPKYLPNVRAARGELLKKMRELEEERAEESCESENEKVEKEGVEYRPWAIVYRYAFSAALTNITFVLEAIQHRTKDIVGEMALDMAEAWKKPREH